MAEHNPHGRRIVKRYQKPALSTGDVAKICGISQHTIINSFDRGDLTGFRIPGSRFRKIPRRNLLQFVRNHELPHDAYYRDWCANVLVFSQDEDLCHWMREHLKPDDALHVLTASDVVSAGMIVGERQLHCIVVDFGQNQPQAFEIFGRMQKACTKAKLVLLDAGEVAKSLGLDDTFERPFDSVLLAAHIKRLVGTP